MGAPRSRVADDFVDKGFPDYGEHRFNVPAGAGRALGVTDPAGAPRRPEQPSGPAAACRGSV
jgi:hypothetical protein